MQQSPTIRRIKAAEDPHFEELVRIYTAAHPKRERKCIGALLSMLARSEYMFIVATIDNSVAGFVIAVCFTGSDACLLEYMAVDENKRGQGIGKYLLEYLMTLEEVASRYLLAEVDSDKSRNSETAENTRRKKFYRHLGCREIEGLRYIMPPVSSSIPEAMDILVYRHNLPLDITKQQLCDWLRCIYTQVYGLQANDRRIDTMLATLPQTIQLI